MAYNGFPSPRPCGRRVEVAGTKGTADEYAATSISAPSRVHHPTKPKPGFAGTPGLQPTPRSARRGPRAIATSVYPGSFVTRPDLQSCRSGEKQISTALQKARAQHGAEQRPILARWVRENRAQVTATWASPATISECDRGGWLPLRLCPWLQFSVSLCTAGFAFTPWKQRQNRTRLTS